MNFFKNVLKMTLLVAASILFFPHYAYSYIDPGTGSYIIQIVIAAFVAVSFMVKIYWLKIKGFIGRLFSKKEQ
jgi:hypothetical protein